jgi:hypothetical protein
MIVKGNPAAKISDIESVEIVFKEGVGYDSEKLIKTAYNRVSDRLRDVIEKCRAICARLLPAGAAAE